MNKVWEYIASGILEMYVLGGTDEYQTREVELMSSLHEEVRLEIQEIRHALSAYVQSNAIDPCPTIKPFLLATIDYLERRGNGEPETFPPLLTSTSKKEDFDSWLSKPEMILPSDFKDYYAKIIGYTPEVTTAIVWIKDSAPFEIHDDQLESFLVLDGACTIKVGEEHHTLVPGNNLTIPLHVGHSVKVTSSEPCKVILQRSQVVSLG